MAEWTFLWTSVFAQVALAVLSPLGIVWIPSVMVWLAVASWAALLAAAAVQVFFAQSGNYGVVTTVLGWSEGGGQWLQGGFVQDLPGSVTLCAISLMSLLSVYRKGFFSSWGPGFLLGALCLVAGSALVGIAQGPSLLIVGVALTALGVGVVSFQEDSGDSLGLPLISVLIVWIAVTCAMREGGGAATYQSWSPTQVQPWGPLATGLLFLACLVGFRIFPFSAGGSSDFKNGLTLKVFGHVLFGTALLLAATRLSPWLLPESLSALRMVGLTLLCVNIIAGLYSQNLSILTSTVVSTVFGVGFLASFSGARMEGLSCALGGGAAGIVLSWLAGQSVRSGSMARKILLGLTILCLVGISVTPVGRAIFALHEAGVGHGEEIFWVLFLFLFGGLLGGLGVRLFRADGEAQPLQSDAPAWLLLFLASGFPWVEGAPFTTMYARLASVSDDMSLWLGVHHVSIALGFCIVWWRTPGNLTRTHPSRWPIGLIALRQPAQRWSARYLEAENRLFVGSLARILDGVAVGFTRIGSIALASDRASSRVLQGVGRESIGRAGAFLERLHRKDVRWYLGLAVAGGALLFGLVLKELWK